MSTLASWVAAFLAFLGLGAAPPAPLVVQGYVEGEPILVAAPVAGQLQLLAVQRGQRVAAGAPLFALDRIAQSAEVSRLEAALDQARAQRADLSTGKRQRELDALAAQRDEAAAAVQLAEASLRRQESLAAHQATSGQRLDEARAGLLRDRARLTEAEAMLDIGHLPARPDTLRAAAAAVAMAEAALAQARQRMAELAPSAPTAALVEDTLFAAGEWVPANAPVVSLLPPEQVKLRFYAPETALARLAPGTRVGFACDGCPTGLTARVTYVAPRAEFTPPVIYSAQSRKKLVFRVEATPEGDRKRLAPGLPIDVTVPAEAAP
ncbi:MAG: HlyD family efflux transporter periplasmic adaptor subunit [Alphaproteobacteria bacterium]|nr:HlyD family efflux transporter periplasmic adaptor subunit [Alphaproteobacteria bacterium]